MIVLPKILYSFFAVKQPSATQLQTLLEPVHEKNVNEGCEFLNDFVQLDEPSDDETE